MRPSSIANKRPRQAPASARVAGRSVAHGLVQQVVGSVALVPELEREARPHVVAGVLADERVLHLALRVVADRVVGESVRDEALVEDVLPAAVLEALKKTVRGAFIALATPPPATPSLSSTGRSWILVGREIGFGGRTFQRRNDHPRLSNNYSDSGILCLKAWTSSPSKRRHGSWA